MAESYDEKYLECGMVINDFILAEIAYKLLQKGYAGHNN